MSKPLHEPRVMNTRESVRNPYLKTRSGISIFWSRFLYNVGYLSRHWKDRVVVKAATVLVVYTAGLYAFTRIKYGSEHPLNRFQWRQMKKNGKLSEEMLRKEEIVNNYMQLRFNRINDKDSVYSIARRSPPGAI